MSGIWKREKRRQVFPRKICGDIASNTVVVEDYSITVLVSIYVLYIYVVTCHIMIINCRFTCQVFKPSQTNSVSIISDYDYYSQKKIMIINCRFTSQGFRTCQTRLCILV